MPWLPRHNFLEWPADAVDLSTPEVLKLYEAGYAGCSYSAQAVGEFRQTMAYPDGDAAAHSFGLADTGAGKLCIPFVYALEMYPGCWPGPGQQTGDCFPAGTMVRMADGSEKNIEDVKAGESVQTHTGQARQVIDVFSKPYDGELVSVRAKGYGRAVEATPDHRVINYPYLWSKRTSSHERNEATYWQEIGNIQPGDYMLLPRQNVNAAPHVFDLSEDRVAVNGTDNPRCIQADSGRIRFKGSKSSVFPRVTLDDRLAWLLGLFLAEGSMDFNSKGLPRRVTFNLARHEEEIANRAKGLIEDIFGTAARLLSVPSKPNVLYVRCGSMEVATLFHRLIQGNTYTKAVPWQIFSCGRQIRLALLRGWLDGDGNMHTAPRSDPRDGKRYGSCKLTGVSVNRALTAGLFDVAASCGLRPTWTLRKARGRSKAANDLHFYGKQALAIYPDAPTTVNVRDSHHLLTALGNAVEVKQVSRRPHFGPVYCIGVEEEHSFVANGFAVHNCVSWGHRTATLVTMCCDIASGKPDEKTGKPEEAPKVSAEGIANCVLSSEAVYWHRGHGGQGWHCPAAATVATKTAGAVLRQNYPEIGIDLTTYSGRGATMYGRSKPPENIVSALGKNLIHTATELNSFEARRDYLFNGYGINTCGGEGYSETRDEWGISKQRGSWAHSMADIGADDRDIIKQKYGEPLILIQNSHGKWNRGGRDIFQSAAMVPAHKKVEWEQKGIVNPSTGNIMIPEGSFWTPWSHCKNREAIAYSGVNGWPRKILPIPWIFG